LAEAINKNHDNQTIRELQSELSLYKERIKDYQEGSAFTARIKFLEASLSQATTHILRLEEALRLFPSFMKPELWSYCNRFRQDFDAVQRAVIEPEEKKLRRDKYIQLIETVPLLQVFFTPSFSFLQNQHIRNGEHEGILSGYFNSLNYRPVVSPVGDPDVIPRLPEYDLKKDEKVTVAAALKKEEAVESRNKYPAIISNSKIKK